MTLLELQEVMGQRIRVHNSDIPAGDIENEVMKSNMIAKLAKQMINNADVILRTEKLIATQENITEAISNVTGVTR